MKKKKFYKISLLTIFLLSIVSGGGYLGYSYWNSSRTNIKDSTTVEEVDDSGNEENDSGNNDNDSNNENSEENEEKPPVIDKTDFASSNLNIEFTLEQKIYLVNFSKARFFNLNEFKFYFVTNFNKLGPKNNSIQLAYYANSKLNPTKISVKYQTPNRIYSWNFELI